MNRTSFFLLGLILGGGLAAAGIVGHINNWVAEGPVALTSLGTIAVLVSFIVAAVIDAEC